MSNDGEFVSRRAAKEWDEEPRPTPLERIRADLVEAIRERDASRARVEELERALAEAHAVAKKCSDGHCHGEACPRSEDCDESDGFRCGLHASPADCPDCDCGLVALRDLAARLAALKPSAAKTEPWGHAKDCDCSDCPGPSAAEETT